MKAKPILNSATLVLSIFSVIVVYSCAEMEKDDGDKVGIQLESFTEKDEKLLSLNDGEKWYTNEEMRLIVLESENRLVDFKGLELDDFTKLGKELEEDIGRITSSCTMSGSSHDELHKWLMPHIKTVGELANSEELSLAQIKFSEIEQSFKRFNQYFQ